jgi:hypothetical protein
MRDGVERGRVSRRRQDAQQEGRWSHRAAVDVSVRVQIADSEAVYLLTAGRTAGFDAVTALDDICFE